jgi:hypothetical protein
MEQHNKTLEFMICWNYNLVKKIIKENNKHSNFISVWESGLVVNLSKMFSECDEGSAKVWAKVCEKLLQIVSKCSQKLLRVCKIDYKMLTKEHNDKLNAKVNVRYLHWESANWKSLYNFNPTSRIMRQLTFLTKQVLCVAGFFWRPRRFFWRAWSWSIFDLY